MHNMMKLQVRHFYKKLYFNPGLYSEEDKIVNDIDDDIAIMTGETQGESLMDESVREVVERLKQLKQIQSGQGYITRQMFWSKVSLQDADGIKVIIGICLLMIKNNIENTQLHHSTCKCSRYSLHETVSHSENKIKIKKLLLIIHHSDPVSDV